MVSFALGFLVGLLGRAFWRVMRPYATGAGALLGGRTIHYSRVTTGPATKDDVREIHRAIDELEKTSREVLKAWRR